MRVGAGGAVLGAVGLKRARGALSGKLFLNLRPAREKTMKVQQLVTEFGVASMTMVFTLALLAPGQVAAADGQPPGVAPLSGLSELTVDGREFTLTTDSAKKAVAHYLAELEEIDRVATLRKAEAKARLDISLQQLEQFETETETGKRYHGMLGSYFNHQGRIPFIMLSVPDGENVKGQIARGTFNAAKYDSAKRLYKFVATGHVVIPRDGSYRLQVSRAAGIKLNGMNYTVGSPVAGKPPYADVELSRGVYQVSFDVGNNGGQLGYAMIRIVENKSETELPIFIYESELKTFRNDPSLGVELRETSGWTRQDNEIQ